MPVAALLDISYWDFEQLACFATYQAVQVFLTLVAQESMVLSRDNKKKRLENMEGTLSWLAAPLVRRSLLPCISRCCWLVMCHPEMCLRWTLTATYIVWSRQSVLCEAYWANPIINHKHLQSQTSLPGQNWGLIQVLESRDPNPAQGCLDFRCFRPGPHVLGHNSGLGQSLGGSTMF